MVMTCQLPGWTLSLMFSVPYSFPICAMAGDPPGVFFLVIVSWANNKDTCRSRILDWTGCWAGAGWRELGSSPSYSPNSQNGFGPVTLSLMQSASQGCCDVIIKVTGAHWRIDKAHI